MSRSPRSGRRHGSTAGPSLAYRSAPCAFSAIFFITRRDAIWCCGSLVAGVTCLGGRPGVCPVVLPGGEPSSAGAGAHQAGGGGSPSRGGVMVQVPRPGGGRGRPGPGCGTDRSPGWPGSGRRPARPVACTGAVAVVVTELAASVKPAVPGGSLAGPRRPRRPR
jgi:hypothetical protein